MKKKYFMLILIFLFVFMASWHKGSSYGKQKAADEKEGGPYYMDIVMGQKIKVSLFDSKSDNKKALEIGEASSLSMQFYAVTDFRSIGVKCPSFSNDIGSLRLSLYKWDLCYDSSLEGKVLGVREFINFRDNNQLNLIFESPLEAGEYLLVIEHMDERVGVWTYQDDFEGIRLYTENAEIPGSLEAFIEYVNTPDVILGPLSENQWWLGGDDKVPEEYVLDKDHPINKLNVRPDTWVATDGLGREMPTYKDVGDKKDRYVGMFYWTWQNTAATHAVPRDITKIDKEFPEAKNDYKHPVWWKYPSSSYYWEEPLYGYYTALDKYVHRKHAELLADAGIDVVFFDCTNVDYIWQTQYEALCESWIEAMNDGVKAPKISFLLNFHDSPTERQNTIRELEKLYTLLYRTKKYQELWFYWEGKPLIMGRYSDLDPDDKLHKAILDYFTFKPGNPYYFTQVPEYQDQWGWLSVYPQTKYGVDDKGNIEQICVGVAQNANDNGLTAMNGEGVYGRAYAKGNYSYTYTYKGKKIKIDKNTEDGKLYGLNFQQQWDYAIKNNPKFIWVTGWNERWTVRLETWGGVENGFSDNYNDEFSRDIEPTTGDLKDHYYYQLVMNVRRFKGLEKPLEIKAKKTIDIDKGYDQWQGVLPEFNHYRGNTPERDIGSLDLNVHFENKTMRNDIIQSKVAYDNDYVYFMVKTVDKLSPQTDPAWMRLFIDIGETDNDWETFEYVVNRESPSENKAYLDKFTGGWNFERVAEVDYTVKDNLLQIKIPREALNFNKKGMPEFTFKWADNTQNDGDIMDFYLNGDVAPGGRFKFAFVKQETPTKKGVLVAIIGSALLLLAAPIVFLIKRKRR